MHPLSVITTCNTSPRIINQIARGIFFFFFLNDTVLHASMPFDILPYATGIWSQGESNRPLNSVFLLFLWCIWHPSDLVMLIELKWNISVIFVSVWVKFLWIILTVLLMLCWGLLSKFFLFELTGNCKCEIFNERV